MGNEKASEGGEVEQKREWDFDLSTVVSSPSDGPDTLGAVEADESLVATGGIARKIRLYSLTKLLLISGDDASTCSLLDHATACEQCICTPAKLGSLRWRPGSGGRVLGSGDYDGMVMEYDLQAGGAVVFERDEHGGRRVWSVDYSHWGHAAAALGASGSDDGTVQLWDPRCHAGDCVAVARPSATARSPVCCVEFDPCGGALLAAGCADRNAYGYDVRNIGAGPVLVMEGHERTVSYVRFLSAGEVVTAGTDGCLKLWGVVGGAGARRTYRGHVNARSFVGMSAWRRGGLLGCGSETNHVYVYDRRWGSPIWVGAGAATTHDGAFVSSVCWTQASDDRSCTLLAGGSDGALQVFLGRKNNSFSSLTSSSSQQFAESSSKLNFL